MASHGSLVVNHWSRDRPRPHPGGNAARARRVGGQGSGWRSQAGDEG